MDKERQCTEIANLCGWKWKECSDGYHAWHKPDGSVSPINRHPRYAYDLNDMREAEGELDDAQWLDYVRILAMDICKCQGHYSQMIAVCHATAAQRAEAFLRTLNKWEE